MINPIICGASGIMGLHPDYAKRNRNDAVRFK